MYVCHLPMLCVGGRTEHCSEESGGELVEEDEKDETLFCR